MTSEGAAVLRRSLGAMWRAAVLPQLVALGVCGLYFHFVLGLALSELAELGLWAFASLAVLGPLWAALLACVPPWRGRPSGPPRADLP